MQDKKIISKWRYSFHYFWHQILYLVKSTMAVEWSSALDLWKSSTKKIPMERPGKYLKNRKIVPRIRTHFDFFRAESSGNLDFKRVEFVETSGNCCWRISSMRNGRGRRQILPPGFSAVPDFPEIHSARRMDCISTQKQPGVMLKSTTESPNSSRVIRFSLGLTGVLAALVYLI